MVVSQIVVIMGCNKDGYGQIHGALVLELLIRHDKVQHGVRSGIVAQLCLFTYQD